MTQLHKAIGDLEPLAICSDACKGLDCLNLPAPFDNEAEYAFLRSFSLNGQTKSAFDKNKPGAWRYDIIDQGLKANLSDVLAAIGLSQLRKYPTQLLPDRKRKFDLYQQAFAQDRWAILPVASTDDRESSCHLYLLRIAGVDEARRDAIIQHLADQGIGVNVHYIPMAMLTLFKNLGYRIEDYPKTYELYSTEITLPLYNSLTEGEIAAVIGGVRAAVESTA